MLRFKSKDSCLAVHEQGLQFVTNTVVNVPYRRSSTNTVGTVPYRRSSTNTVGTVPYRRSSTNTVVSVSKVGETTGRYLSLHSWKIIIFLCSKIAIYLTPSLQKYVQAIRRSRQPSKENIQNFKTWNFFIFFYFVCHFWPPGSGSVSGSQTLF